MFALHWHRLIGQFVLQEYAMTTPNNSQMTTRTPVMEQKNMLTISLPPTKLRPACEGWIKIAAVLRSYEEREKQAATCDSIFLESRFLLGDESCCELCFTVGEAASRIVPPESAFDRRILGAAVFDFNYPSVKVYSMQAYRFVLPPAMFSPWEEFFTRAPQSVSTMDKIRRLVSRCDSLHLCYDTETEKPPLPTRVLDISRGPEQIFLREGTGIQDQYVCLSHCWGSKQPLQTTTRTIENHQRNIPWDMFPVVYKEAVLISWELGVKYIWIDSLCIIQDSVVEWAQESGKMGLVYAGSYLTVAATSSVDCSVSMLEPLLSKGPREEQERITECRISNQDDLEQPEHCLISMVESKHGYWDHDFAAFYDIYRHMPLLSRAWTYQEQLLSPRLVHLTPTELVWQCKRGVLCDCGYMNFSGQEFDLPFYRVMEKTESSQSGDNSSGQIASLWRSIVMHYSKRQLTYDKDKLPALSGLAHMFSLKRPGAKYLAGVWGDADSPSLLLDLMWHRRLELAARNDLAETRCKDWVAPSFSWASIRAEVVFPVQVGHESSEFPPVKGSLEEVYVDILDAHCEPSTLDPMGQVKSGFLKVKGRALAGCVIATEYAGGFCDLILDDGRVHGFIADVEKDELWGAGIGPKNTMQVDVMCVPWARVCRSIMIDDVASYSGEEWALVLHSTADSKNSIESRVFSRVGMLRGRFLKRSCKTREEYDAFWAQSPGLFEDKRQEVHTFTIV
ncbi:Heterokaryon incompatibility protein (HET) domain containing protein [Rhypophila sp. PSN 637]